MAQRLAGEFMPPTSSYILLKVSWGATQPMPLSRLYLELVHTQAHHCRGEPPCFASLLYCCSDCCTAAWTAVLLLGLLYCCSDCCTAARTAVLLLGLLYRCSDCCTAAWTAVLTCPLCPPLLVGGSNHSSVCRLIRSSALLSLNRC